MKNTAEEPETPGPETDKPAQPETPSPETAAPQDETDAPVPQTEAPKKKETEKKETEKKETEKKTPPAETPEQIAEKAAEIAGRITGIKGAYRVPADKLTEEEKKVLTAAGYRLMDTDGDGTLDTYVLGAAGPPVYVCSACGSSLDCSGYEIEKEHLSQVITRKCD